MNSFQFLVAVTASLGGLLFGYECRSCNGCFPYLL